jgi:glucan phosphoethanolaminetransferase (alkaline phosphatase superfamily)
VLLASSSLLVVSADTMPLSPRPRDVTAPALERLARPGDERRGRARARRWVGRLSLVMPGVAVIGCDLALRLVSHRSFTTSSGTDYARAAVLSVLFWGALTMVATARHGADRWVARGLLVALTLTAVGGQLYTFGRYRAFLDTSSMLVGTGMMTSVGQLVWTDHASFLRAVLPPLAAVALLAFAQRRLAPPRQRSRRIAGDAAAVLLLAIAFYAPPDDDGEVAPFDSLYIHGVGQLARAVWDKNPILARAHPGPRSPLPVAAITAHPPVPRNVLFILTESVRAASSCVVYDPDCKTTPFSNAAAKNRIPLTQMRSVDSTTAISLGVMWSGVAPSGTREALHSAPLLWEYAIAADVDTAYWTSQNLLFGNSGAWLDGIAWGHYVSATGIDPDATLETGADDGALVTYANEHLATLREPFVAVVHLSNTHMPYDIDESDAPFLPQSRETDRAHATEISNRYFDAIYHQDRAIGRLIEAERARPEGARTVIVFLSDHGEQLYEKGGYGHTGTLFEPEIHIPAWVDAPPGTLSPQEEATLRSVADRPLTTMDVLPTMLDLVGVLDAPAIAPLTKSLVGKSILRGGSPLDAPVVLTNCTELWACAFKNWGAMAGTHKLIASQADHTWLCYDTENDPEEMHDLGPAGCGDLRALAEASGHGRPF